MREDHRACGVNTAGEIVRHHVKDVIGDVLGAVTVGDHLVVCDDDVGAHAKILQADTFLDRTKVVTEMQATGGTVTREHGVVLGMDKKVPLDLVGAPERRLEASFIWHTCSPWVSRFCVGTWYGTCSQCR